MAARLPKPPDPKFKQQDNTDFYDSPSFSGKNFDSIEDKSSLSKFGESSIFSKQNNQIGESSHQNIQCFLKKNDCPCTNISIMHLFHEMKQKFPTVPDNIVNNCVVSNCHDREICIRSLENELKLHSTTSQSYPSNALRSQTLLQQQNNNLEITTTNDQQLYSKASNIKKNHNYNINNKINNTNNNNNNNNNNSCNSNNNNYHLNNGSTNNNEINFNYNNKVLKPTRPAPTPNYISKNVGDNKNSSLNTKMMQKKPAVLDFIRESKQHKCLIDKDDIENTIIKHPQRPTSLNFRELIHNENENVEKKTELAFCDNTNDAKLKPVRKAPAPPLPAISPTIGSTTPLSSSSSQFATPTISSRTNFSGHNLSNADCSHSSSIQSPYSDSNESEISVNISLSPTIERSRIATTTTGQHAQPQTPRRITSITLNPEPPYTRDFIQNASSQRSYTSLNLTLRKPSSMPQSPIDITAGPGLTYSSSSFDAGRGLQKSFHISVNAEGGVFRASSIRPNSSYLPPIPYQDEEFQNIGHTSILRPACSEQNFYKNLLESTCDKIKNTKPIDTTRIEKIYGNVELLERQKVCKEKLINTIEKNRNKLKLVNDEINILRSPEFPGESEKLDSDIERLRGSCEILFNEIENSKRLAGNQILNVDEFNCGNNHFRQRPPRPPPPRILGSTVNNSASTNDLMHQENNLSIIPNINSTTPTSTLYYPEVAINNLPDEDGPQWSCKHCTFLNDPLMIRCENCDYDKDIPGIYKTYPNINTNDFNSSTNSQSSLINIRRNPNITYITRKNMHDNYLSGSLNTKYKFYAVY